jgi:uncharacterized membrane protein YGL010W
MKSVTDHLANYASYHQDRRNIATHFIGIPMIFFSIVLFLSRPAWNMEAWIPFSPAVVMAILVGIFYLKLDIALGVLMALIFMVSLHFAAPVAAASTTVWLVWAIGLFVLGWAFQTIGHIWEGKKPAFVDDLIGLLIGPLFLVAEVVFALGARDELRRSIDEKIKKMP